MKKRPSPPSKMKICDYWMDNYTVERVEDVGHEGRGHECGMGADMSEWMERCWCCGRIEDLERCHIIPFSIGGSNHPSNFVLLCNSCHKQAPNVNCKDEIWRFIYKNRAFVYLTKEQQDYMDKVLVSLLKQTSIHFGEGVLNDSTKKWVSIEYNKAFVKKFAPQFYDGLYS